VVAYRISFHRWVGNDHYDPVPVKEVRVALPPTGTLVRVLIP
jgi:hypothetical protein